MTAWTVRRVDRVVDGDTVRLVRQRTLDVVDGLAIIAEDVSPVAVRLVHVDTPERGEAGWADAKSDLEIWIGAHPDLVLEDAGMDNFGRRLGDLQSIDGCTASLYLVQRGWPVWHAG